MRRIQAHSYGGTVREPLIQQGDGRTVRPDHPLQDARCIRSVAAYPMAVSGGNPKFEMREVVIEQLGLG